MKFVVLLQMLTFMAIGMTLEATASFTIDAKVKEATHRANMEMLMSLPIETLSTVMTKKEDG